MASYVNDPVWAEVVKNLIKGEKGKSGMEFSELTRALEENYNIIQSRDNLITKVNRGTFSAQLFLALLKCMDVESINLNEIDKMLERARERIEEKSNDS